MIYVSCTGHLDYKKIIGIGSCLHESYMSGNILNLLQRLGAKGSFDQCPTNLERLVTERKFVDFDKNPLTKILFVPFSFFIFSLVSLSTIPQFYSLQ